MNYDIQVMFPESETTVTGAELPDAYAKLEGVGATVTWNNYGRDVLIVAVDGDDCVISLKSDETWYYLTVGDDEETVPFDMGGTDSEVPAKAVVPRPLGLTVLQRAADLPGLRTDYMWDEQ